MASDVKLDGDNVVVEGSTQVNGAEIFLDRLHRGGPRRALVHDLNDQLLINCGGDYPEGVKIMGATMEGSVTVNGAEIFLDRLHKGGPRRALVHNLNDQLLINCGRDYPEGVEIVGPVVITEGTQRLDLVNVIMELKKDIEELKKLHSIQQ